LACFLGGIIGAERESENKNAGFRTHMLVCIASTLVMITSEYIFNTYSGFGSSLDPARLGAQVISGIGFLGAGAIIRDGFQIRGLTTAASLWAVACIGLACGIGFYFGAMVTTFITLLVLFLMKKMGSVLSRGSNYELTILTLDKPGQIGAIGTILGNHYISIQNLKVVSSDDEDIIKIKVVISLKHKNELSDFIIEELNQLDGIKSVHYV